MKILFALVMMVAAGMVLAGVLSGTAHAPAQDMDLAGLLPARIDPPSFAWGIAAGFVLSFVLRTSWRDLPQRLLAWLFANRRGFRLAGWGAAFAAVLFLY